MTNDFNQINGDSEFRDEMTISPEEVFTAADDLDENDEMVDDDDPNEVSLELAPDVLLEMEYEDRVSGCDDEQEPDQGWPGDGSGEDDFADYNSAESDDYRDE